LRGYRCLARHLKSHGDLDFRPGGHPHLHTERRRFWLA
jgi:hypothetical protein